MPDGIALYVRRISKGRHGTPKQFARKCVDHGLSWIALGGLWQDVRNGKATSRMINSVDTIHRYGDELEARGVDVFVWGYPWQGREAAFAERTVKAAKWGRVLLDPELGANPTRSSKGTGKLRANAHAAKLVEFFADQVDELGLSTFGSGWRMGWFPLTAFTKALIEHFGGHTFIGGQTYTDDGAIDVSIAGMMRTIEKAGGQVIQAGTERSVFWAAPDGAGMPERGVEVVPNFGTYTWELNGKRGKRRRGAKSKAKTPAELRSHLFEFVNESEPVDALIGWAENFMTKALWNELARFADMHERGAFRL